MNLSKYRDLSLKGNRVLDHDAVLNMVQNILAVRINEIPFRRHLGSTLETYLFMPFTFSTSMLLMGAIKQDIPTNNANLKVLNSSTINLDIEKQEYQISLHVEAKGLNSPVTYQTSFKYKG